jgi:hypothetical protein
LKAKQCRRIAEIGGLLLRVVDDPDVPLGPDLYVNIDPSTEYSAVTSKRNDRHGNGSTVCELELPLTTQQFAGIRAENGHSFEFDCVVVLGAMPGQFADGAIRSVLQNARLLIMDEAMTLDPKSPCSKCVSFRAAEPLLHTLGFAYDAEAIRARPVGARGVWRTGVSPLCHDILPGGLLLDCRKNTSNVVLDDEDLNFRQLAVFSRRET